MQAQRAHINLDLDISITFSTILNVTKIEKTLEKMRNNPRDWQITDLEVVASHVDIVVRKGKGSHVSFTHPRWVDILTVPAHRPIKPIYVKKLVSLIDALREEKI